MDDGSPFTVELVAVAADPDAWELAHRRVLGRAGAVLQARRYITPRGLRVDGGPPGIGTAREARVRDAEGVVVWHESRW